MTLTQPRWHAEPAHGAPHLQHASRHQLTKSLPPHQTDESRSSTLRKDDGQRFCRLHSDSRFRKRQVRKMTATRRDSARLGQTSMGSPPHRYPLRHRGGAKEDNVDEGTFLSDWSPYPTAPSTARSCSPFCCRPRGGTIRSFSFAFLFLFFRAADGQAQTQNKHRRAIARHEEKDVYRSTYRCIAIIPLRKKLTDLQSLQTPPFQSQTIARFNSNFQLLKLKKSKNQKINAKAFP